MARLRVRPSLTMAGLTALAIVAWVPVRATTDQAIGYFEASGDVGSPAIAGIDRLRRGRADLHAWPARGTNMWAARDEFQFAWRKMNGDFIIRTHAAFLGTGIEPHRKIGIDHPQGPGRRRPLRGRGGPRRRADLAAVPRRSRAARPCNCPSAVVAPT